MFDHDPSEVGILRPIVIKGSGSIIDQLIARGTLKETVPVPECANSHAVQPMYRYVSEQMPAAKVSIAEGLQDYLLRATTHTSTKG